MPAPIEGKAVPLKPRLAEPSLTLGSDSLRGCCERGKSWHVRGLGTNSDLSPIAIQRFLKLGFLCTLLIEKTGELVVWASLVLGQGGRTPGSRWWDKQAVPTMVPVWVLVRGDIVRWGRGRCGAAGMWGRAGGSPWGRAGLGAAKQSKAKWGLGTPRQGQTHK